MKGADVTVRMYREGDGEQLVALFQQSFEAWPGADVAVPARDYLRWKYRHDAPGPRRHVVAESGGVIVGAWMAWSSTVMARGRALRAVHARDVCVLPGFRNQGVVKRITDFAMEGLQQCYDLRIGGLTRHEGLLRMHAAGNHPPLGNPPRMFRLSRPGSSGPEQAARHGFEIVDASSFDERFDGFCAAASAPFDVILARDHRYLNWRYCDPRAGGFSVRAAQRDGVVLGYAVLRLQPSWRRGNIADLLVLPDRLDVARALIDDAVASFARAGARRVDCWLPEHHPYAGVLLHRGFRGTETIAFNYVPLATAAEELAFLEDPGCMVHMMKGDTDAI